MSERLDALAELAGIEPSYSDYFGAQTHVSDATKRALLAAMGYAAETDEEAEATLQRARAELRDRVVPPVVVVREGDAVDVARWPDGAGDDAAWQVECEDGRRLCGTIEGSRIRIDAPLPLGYHRLRVSQAEAELIVVPQRCYVSDAMERGRIWALATQLYALRSERNWGIGDFTDLRTFASLAGRAGAGAVALNPLHELHPCNPQAASPYAPSSRLFLNAMYIDVQAVPEFAESAQAQAAVAGPEFHETLRSLHEPGLVDYGGVASAKRAMLELLFRTFCTGHLERPGDVRAAAFRRFVRDGGDDLERLARYEALAEHFRAGDPHGYGWLQWPSEYRDPHSEAVAQFARERRDRVDFYSYLQWVADEQLTAAARHARARSGIGLYRDLAVGVDLNGADAWGDPVSILAGAALGAPPDPLNALGQNWGLPPLSPRALRERAYAPLRRLLRANMRHAAILRIDHVMALRRAFWIPRGRPATEGAYVRYDFEEMLGILALESARNCCTVVGEDLGTVPEGFRERLGDARVLSSRLVYFERGFLDGVFASPATYPRLAAASIGTHDLPPLAGWWTGDDIAVRTQIGLYPSDDAAADAVQERRHARFMLVDALERSGAADESTARTLREDAERGGTFGVAEQLSAAVHRFLAQTPLMLAVVAIEDVLDETAGVNVPGTVDEHPNWRRKRSMTLEEMECDARLLRIGAIMCDTGAVTLPEGTL